MSHTTKLLAVPVKDISSLYQAAAELSQSGVNCSIKQNIKPRMYFENQVGACPYILSLPDCRYDVGFELQPDGSYLPLIDMWGNHVQNSIGAACRVDKAEDAPLRAIGRFMQSYSKNAAINAAVAAGYMVDSCVIDSEGNVQLEISVN